MSKKIFDFSEEEYDERQAALDALNSIIDSPIRNSTDGDSDTNEDINSRVIDIRSEDEIAEDEDFDPLAVTKEFLRQSKEDQDKTVIFSSDINNDNEEYEDDDDDDDDDEDVDADDILDILHQFMSDRADDDNNVIIYFVESDITHTFVMSDGYQNICINLDTLDQDPDCIVINPKYNTLKDRMKNSIMSIIAGMYPMYISNEEGFAKMLSTAKHIPSNFMFVIGNDKSSDNNAVFGYYTDDDGFDNIDRLAEYAFENKILVSLYNALFYSMTAPYFGIWNLNVDSYTRMLLSDSIKDTTQKLEKFAMNHEPDEDEQDNRKFNDISEYRDAMDDTMDIIKDIIYSLSDKSDDEEVQNSEDTTTEEVTVEHETSEVNTSDEPSDITFDAKAVESNIEESNDDDLLSDADDEVYNAYGIDVKSYGDDTRHVQPMKHSQTKMNSDDNPSMVLDRR